MLFPAGSFSRIREFPDCDRPHSFGCPTAQYAGHAFPNPPSIITHNHVAAGLHDHDGCVSRARNIAECRGQPVQRRRRKLSTEHTANVGSRSANPAQHEARS